MGGASACHGVASPKGGGDVSSEQEDEGASSGLEQDEVESSSDEEMCFLGDQDSATEVCPGTRGVVGVRVM